MTPEQKAAMDRLNKGMTNGSEALSPVQSAALKRLGATIDGDSPERSVSDALGDVLDQFTQGVTFNFGDELTATEAGLLGRTPDGDWFNYEEPFEKRYNDALAAERAQQDAFQDDHPILSTASNIAGGVATGGLSMAKVLGTQAVRNAPLLARIAAAGGVGATEGAIAGYGAGEGVNDRLMNAGIGGVAGGAIGAGLPAVGHAAKRFVVDPIRQRMSPAARQKMADEFIRRAARLDDISPEDIAKKVGDMGPDAAMVDVGPNMKSLGEYAANRMGEGLTTATDFALDRRAGQFARIMGKLKKYADPLAGDVMDRVEDSQQFKDALSVRVKPSKTLVRLMTRPSMRRAWQEAKDAAEDAGVEMVDFDDFKDAYQRGEVAEVETTLLHWLKKGLDDVLEPKRGADGIINPTYGKNRTSIQNNLRNAFRSEVKRLNPAYGKELDRLSAEFKVDDAFESGQKFFEKKLVDRSAVKKAMENMSNRERRAFQSGVMDAIETKIIRPSDVGDDASKLLNRNLTKLEEVFGDKTGKLRKELYQETQFMRTENDVLRNSRTNLRENIAKEIEGGMPTGAAATAADVATGNAGNVVNRIANTVFGPARPANQTLDDVSKVLFNRDLKAAQDWARRNAEASAAPTVMQYLLGGSASSNPSLLEHITGQ